MGIESFPVEIKDIPKIESLNKLSINVFGLHDNNDVYSLLISKIVSDKYIDLFYCKEHCFWIKNLSRFISKQQSDHGGKSFICRYCLHFYS